MSKIRSVPALLFLLPFAFSLFAIENVWASACFEQFQDEPNQAAVELIHGKVKAAPAISDLQVIRVMTGSDSISYVDVVVDERNAVLQFHLQAIQSYQAKNLRELIEATKQALSILPPKKPRFNRVGFKKQSSENRAIEIDSVYEQPLMRDFYAALVLKLTAKTILNKNLTLARTARLNGERVGSLGYSLISLGDRSKIEIIMPLQATAVISLDDLLRALDSQGQQVEPRLALQTRVSFDDIKIVRAQPNAEKERSVFPIQFGGSLGIADVQLAARSPTERRFKNQEIQYENAKPSELVSVEWIFNAQFMPDGHTAFRVGNTAVEFTSRGMVLHEGGRDSARAFLFNNPSLTTVYELYKKIGAQPFSMGVEFMMPKQEVEKFLYEARSYNAENGRKFDFFFNNCNQCMIRLLQSASTTLPVPLSTIERFSSVLSIRAVLESSQIPKTGIYLYPSGAKQETDSSLREMFKARMTGDHSAAQEIAENSLRSILRTVRDLTSPSSWPRYWRRQVTKPKSKDSAVVSEPKPE
jgi:hypothetical protein